MYVWLMFGYISLVLALPVLICSASDYWRSALLSVRQRVVTLDVPIDLQLPIKYEKRKRLDPWPVSTIAFLAVALIGCGTFIVFCSRHPADLVAADYYEQEVRYQGQINRLQHAGLSTQLGVAYDAAARLITISLPPSQSNSHATGNIQLYRPSATDLDRVLKLEPNSSPHFPLSIPFRPAITRGCLNTVLV